MKLGLFKQIMHDKATVDSLAREVDQHRLQIETGKFKLSDARKMTKEYVKNEGSDPFTFSRIVSGLMNSSMTPRDLKKTHN